jgi:hypothetical protein
MMSEFEDGFAVHFDEISRCRRNECYWALLHVLVMLPDVCAALESENGQAHPDKYQPWCDQYFKDPMFTGADRYALRCVLLHQGRTAETWGQYRSYSLVHRTPSGHRLIADFGTAGKNFTLDVDNLADETVLAIRAWFAALQRPANASRLRYARQHIRWLAREGTKTIPDATGITFTAPTTSSTGGFASGGFGPP